MTRWIRDAGFQVVEARQEVPMGWPQDVFFRVLNGGSLVPHPGEVGVGTVWRHRQVSRWQLAADKLHFAVDA